MGATSSSLFPSPVPVKPSANKPSNVPGKEKKKPRKPRAARKRQQGVDEYVMVEAVKAEATKRKAEPEEEVPRKRQQGVGEAAKVEAVRAKVTKRKAKPEEEVPRKRQQGVGEAAKVEAVRAKGTKGTKGTKGIKGIKGTKGTKGINGNKGTKGIKGIKGTKGTKGTKRIKGIKGTKRIKGIKGTKGTKGIKGTKRKAEPEEEVPTKRQRLHNDTPAISKPTEGTVKDGSRRGIKRKASPDRESPNKKQRAPNDFSDTSDSIRVTTRAWRRKRGLVEPDTTAPKMEAEGGGCGPPTSVQESIPLPGRTSKDFEDRYVELEKLGEGGFGSVYAGKRRSDNFPVAIKHICQDIVERQRVILHQKKYMIPKEVCLMMKVSSSAAKPLVISLLDWYDLDDEVLLVMERPIPSVDLYEYVHNNGGPLQEDMVKSIMKQMVEASIHMHSVGVLHSDLKLENVLVHPGLTGPRVRIIDFGCGCSTQKRAHRLFSGTTDYAPPEFFSRGAYADGPATVWQLGVMMYQMLDGQQEFSTSMFLHNKIKVNNGLSRNCRDLLKACWAMDPKKRTTLEQMRQHTWLN